MGLAPCKMARVMLSEWALLGMARPTVAALERVVGKSQHALLPQRHGMAVLESLFFFESERSARTISPSPKRRHELGMLAALLPLSYGTSLPPVVRS